MEAEVLPTAVGPATTTRYLFTFGRKIRSENNVIYRIIRPMARLASLLYFRKIYLLNVEAVPKKGPLLLVCNHPSSFFEACILAVLLPRPLYFLTRGDFFKKKAFSWFLRQTHQIPIFRSQDGFDKLRNNQDTFAYCYQALREQKAILIFPESWTILEKRLRPMQKGAARLALGALRHIPDLNIFPVGVTFSNPLKFRGTVTVKCGNPIPVSLPPDTSDERAMMAVITSQIEKALRSLIIQIDQSEREPMYDMLQEITFHDSDIPKWPVISANDHFPAVETRLAEYTNTLSPDKESWLRQKINAYQETLRRYRLTDRHFTFTNRLSKAGRMLLAPAVVFLALGKIIFAIPTWFVIRFINAKIHKLPFYGPVKWVMGFYLIGPWCLMCLLAGYLIGGVAGMLVVFAWVMLGIIALLYFHDVSLKGFLTPLTLSSETRNSIKALRTEIANHE